ncbi:unnamed protein product [Rotaria magnacalcarata]|uniref:DYW domain-containing protein n=1 Tax=Rotaria magnacalcarata TaxID=392030 RepID=A0A814JVY5_9BILA|nr:unnamed protein product [Rotaria magnacalcarata]CAF3933309.1 unnamed protein product [Rotaria magnacalcarata]
MLMIRNNSYWIYRFNRLLSSYLSKNGENLFSSSVTLNSTMKKLFDSKQYKEALNLFDQNFEICNDSTIDMAIKACTVSKDYSRGTRIQQRLSSKSLNNSYIQATLLRFYLEFKDIDNAMHLFSSITNKSNYIYTIMFKGLITNNMAEKVFDLLHEMKIEPNQFTFTVVFNACAAVANDRARKIGKKVLAEIPENYRNNTILLTSAVNMLMKFGDVESAERIFRSIKTKNIITYGAMMKGYIGNEMFEKALDLFEQIDIQLDGVTYTIVFNACAKLCNSRAIKIGRTLLADMPEKNRNDNVIINSAIDMLMKFGDIKNAERIFRSVKAKCASTYGVLMKGYNLNGESWKCFKIFEEMNQKGIIPDEITWNILIGACSNSGMLHHCQYIMDRIPLNIQNNIQIQNSLIDMWGKCGSVEKAKNIFNLVVDRDTITYTAMINAFGLNGMGTRAVELYREMPNNLRNHFSHICVLNACSHAGLLHEARTIFNEISLKTELIVTTMVDCLSRLFMFNGAQMLIDDYEKINTPSIAMYMSLLSGARNNRNSNLSEKIYERMKSLFPNEKESLASGVVLLANIYSSLGEHEEAKNFRSSQIKELGVKVKVGLSWTEIKGQIVQFKAHDHSHPQSAEIYAKIDRLKSKAIENGFIFDSSWITRSLNENETIESVLCGHSELLVIALNLIQEPVPKFIQVVKNLRVCGHCHQFTKVIAKIEQCDIVVRDANRIHHFYPNGQCSCQDHF